MPLLSTFVKLKALKEVKMLISRGTHSDLRATSSGCIVEGHRPSAIALKNSTYTKKQLALSEWAVGPRYRAPILVKWLGLW